MTEIKELDIRTVQPEALQRLEDITIDPALSAEERKQHFLKQIQNPYFFRCGKLIVQVEYRNTDKTISDCLKEYIESQIH